MNILDSEIPNSVEMDPWLVFHGSSNIYQEAINQSGLRPNASSFSLSELKQVEAVFTKLYWDGDHPSGYAVLKPFSIGHDHNHQEGKPLYLAESVQRASLYATSDFAGGEICRALYYCLEDLIMYLEDDHFREQHVRKLEMRPGRERIDRTLIPKLDWVRNEVELLSNIKDRISAIRNSFSYGLIYAIRLDEKKLNDISHARSMGLKSFRPILKSEIHAVYSLPHDFEHIKSEDKKMFESIINPGIMKTIRDKV